jgi:hypothetical protein
VVDSGEDGVRGVASGPLEIATAEMAFGLHMADHGLDGGAAAQFALTELRPELRPPRLAGIAAPHDQGRRMLVRGRRRLR